VLITGGRDSRGTMVATAEVFDPANQTSTAIGVLNTARINHTATLLADARVLIVRGTSGGGQLPPGVLTRQTLARGFGFFLPRWAPRARGTPHPGSMMARCSLPAVT